MTSETELLARIASGDKSAMKTFFLQHHASLFAFLRSRGADAQAADDAVQDAMMDVWRTACQFKNKASAKTWLFKIARNKMIDRHRKVARFDVVDEVPEPEETEPDAEAALIAASDAARVRACLGKLKPHHLSSIRLAFYEEQTYAQIGQIEGVPEGTVKARIFHAKRLLLKCLGRR